MKWLPSLTQPSLGELASMRMPPPFRGFRAALIFLTRIPVGGEGYRDADWRWSTAWFPSVGALIGIFLGGLWMGLSPLGPWPCAFIVIGIAMLITGGFHEDGLADTADAMGGAYDRERLFIILKDSRVGAFGAMALFVALGLRAAFLAGLGEDSPASLVATECLSRLPPIWLMVLMPYATDDAQAKSRQVTRAQLPQGVFATCSCVLVCSLLHHFGYLTVEKLYGLAAAMLATGVYCGWRFHRRAGGVTGDFLGATQQVGQLGMLAVLLWPSA